MRAVSTAMNRKQREREQRRRHHVARHAVHRRDGEDEDGDHVEAVDRFLLPLDPGLAGDAADRIGDGAGGGEKEEQLEAERDRRDQRGAEEQIAERHGGNRRQRAAGDQRGERQRHVEPHQRREGGRGGDRRDRDVQDHDGIERRHRRSQAGPGEGEAEQRRHAHHHPQRGGDDEPRRREIAAEGGRGRCADRKTAAARTPSRRDAA